MHHAQRHAEIYLIDRNFNVGGAKIVQLIKVNQLLVDVVITFFEPGGGYIFPAPAP